MQVPAWPSVHYHQMDHRSLVLGWPEDLQVPKDLQRDRWTLVQE